MTHSHFARSQGYLSISPSEDEWERTLRTTESCQYQNHSINSILSVYNLFWFRRNKLFSKECVITTYPACKYLFPNVK